MSYRKQLISALVLAIAWLAAPAGAAPASSTSANGSVKPVALVMADAPAPSVLRAALDAYNRAERMGAVAKAGLLTIIDYSRPSVEPRLWVIDLKSGRSLYHELVAHGRGSGENLATTISNAPDSHMSSLGLFVTGQPYVGKNGYSLRLQGLDAGVNDNALARALVVHGAPYVNAEMSRRLGRLGRSWGCPAVPEAVARPLIDTIKGGSVVFAYGPVASELRAS